MCYCFAAPVRLEGRVHRRVKQTAKSVPTEYDFEMVGKITELDMIEAANWALGLISANQR